MDEGERERALGRVSEQTCYKDQDMKKRQRFLEVKDMDDG